MAPALVARFAVAYVPLLLVLEWAIRSLDAPLPVGVEAASSAALLAVAALGTRALAMRAAHRPPTSREWARAVAGMLAVDTLALVALAALSAASNLVPALAIGVHMLAVAGTVVLHAGVLYTVTLLSARTPLRPRVQG